MKNSAASQHISKRPGSAIASHQRGFSMIELILALGLGLIVTAGVVQLFVGNNQTYTVLTGQSRLQESARYAMDFITRSARATGYYGCDPDNDKIYNTLNGTWVNLFEMDLTSPIQAFDYTGDGTGTDTGDWTPSIAVLPRMTGVGSSINTVVDGTGINLDDLVPNTDILVFRRVEVPGAPIADITQAVANPITVIDEGDIDFAVDDFAVISNCEQAALFRITGVAAGAPAASGEATLVLNRDSGAGIYENAAGVNLSDLGIPYGNAVDSQAATVGRVITDIYYIADGTGQNNFGQAPRSLWRRSGTNAPQELIEGVWDLQVRFGIDTTPNDNNRSANRYVDFNSVAANDVVRALRLEITTSTIDVVVGDEPTRRTFVQTISLRNT
jgi:type IV pilus assembly protein PilW